MARRPRNALICAVLCLAGLALTGAVALLVPSARAHDSATLGGFTALGDAHVQALANTIAHLVDPRPYAIAGAVLAVIALLRRRPRVAAAVPLAMFGAAASSELLKPLLAEPRYSEWLADHGSIMAASWPSGHATAAMMLALCSVIVAPRSWRVPVALAGAALAVGVSYSVLVLAWHFPSDVFGGFLLAGTWCSLTLAALWWADRRWPAPRHEEAPTRDVVATVSFALFGAGALAAIVLGREDLQQGWSTAHGSFVMGAAAIAALAVMLAGSLALALRR
jgi:membrane-associated phospholipid phosphatase